MKKLILGLFAGVLLFTSCKTDNRNTDSNAPETENERSAPEEDTKK